MSLSINASGQVLNNSTEVAKLAVGTLAGNGPAFSAYLGTNQALSSSTLTKVQINTEVYDTAGCFDTTTYRFTPNVAGYYVFTGATYYNNGGTSIATSIYKNGASISQMYASNYGPSATVITYMNGSTDYVELYAYFVGTTSLYARNDLTYFQGFLARSA